MKLLAFFLSCLVAIIAVLATAMVSTPAYAVTVEVTEKVPGANCSGGTGSPQTRRATCEIGRGFESVMEILSGMIKYGTFLIVLIGVLMIVASGVQISMGAIDSSMREDAKKRITQVLTGLAFLFLVSMILNTVAPWVYR